MDASYILGQINNFSEEIDDDVIGIFLVKLHDWNIKSFVPIIHLTKNNLYIQLKDKSTRFDLNKIHNTELSDNILKIEHNGDQLKLSLVEINDNFSNPSVEYTKRFKTLLDRIITDNYVDLKLIESLPNQKSVGITSNKGLVILIVGILFIVMSFIFQIAFPTVSWFLLFSGLLMSIIGVTFTIFGKR